MPFERLKATAVTLRFRLALWNAGAVFLTGLVVLIGLREGTRLTLIDEMDQVQLDDMNEVTAILSSIKRSELPAHYAELNRKAREHKHHQWFVRFDTPEGEIVWASDTAPDRRLQDSVEDTRPVTVREEGVRIEWRICRARVKLLDGTPLVATIGSNFDFVNDDMTRIDSVAIVAGTVVLILSPLFGYWLAGRAIEPLAEIISHCDKLRPARLHYRLPVHQTGDELDQLSQTINGLVDRIASYLTKKQDFLANAAHELRTPLAAIRSSVEVALGEDRRTIEYQELLAEIITECEFLEALVNQLLLIAETDADRLQHMNDFVPLHEVAFKATEMFRGVSESQGVALHFHSEGPAIVEGTRHHLRQVLNNLLDNALKFTPAGGSVTVEIHRDLERQKAILQVRDTGVGIPAEDIPHIFERFYRADKSRQREGKRRGTGLGLSICEAVVEAHGGTIKAESEHGQGTTMTIELPLAMSRMPARV